MSKRWNFGRLIISAYLFSVPALSVAFENTYLAWVHPTISGTAGISDNHVKKNQANHSIDLNFYNYQNENQDSARLFWGGFLGNEFQVAQPWLWALDLGVGYYQPETFHGSGTLTQGADAALANMYNYNYNLQSKQVLLEGKFSWKVKERFFPYASLGLGSAFNTASGYNTTANYSDTPMFASHMQRNFSYSFGVGFDFAISKHLKLGAGYRFSSLGRANLGNGTISGTSFPSNLKQGKLYATQILAQLTYTPGTS